MGRSWRASSDLTAQKIRLFYSQKMLTKYEAFFTEIYENDRFSQGVGWKCKVFFPKDGNLGVLKSIRVQLRVWGWAGVGACGGEGVGGRPDPPDGRKSVRDFSLGSTSVAPIYHLCTDRIASGGAMNDWFSKHKWTKMMQTAGFPLVYYWKSDHSSIFKA